MQSCQLDRVRNLVTLERGEPIWKVRREITIRDLIRTALRMRPDRIIVGEVRGAEAIDMLQAMNTGHDGSLITYYLFIVGEVRERRQSTAEAMNTGHDGSLSTGHATVAGLMRRGMEDRCEGMDLRLWPSGGRSPRRRSDCAPGKSCGTGAAGVLESVETDGDEDGDVCLHSLFEFQEETEGQKGGGSVKGSSEENWTACSMGIR